MEAKDLTALTGRTGWRELVRKALYLFPIHVCNCCGKKTWYWGEIIPHVIGLQRDSDDKPALVLWNCPGCKSTKAVSYRKAPEAVRLAGWEAPLPSLPPIFALFISGEKSRSATN